MNYKSAGRSSSLQLLLSGSWSLFLLASLIGGHIILLFVVYGWLVDESGLGIVMKSTGLPAWFLVLWILSGLGMDGWITHNVRKDRKKAMER